MVTRYAPALAAAMIAAVQLAGCSSVPAYSYYPVPCPPSAAAATPPAPNAASQSPLSATVPPSAPAAGAPTASGAPDAAGTPPSPAANCVVAVPNYEDDYGYAGGYYPYWDYGSPYYGGIGFSGFVDGRFLRGFHDHDFHGGFHHHDFHDSRHAGGFHGGGFHAGGFHGGGGGHR